MVYPEYVINGKFKISVETNEITTLNDDKHNDVYKIEPRTMEVLGRLLDADGNLVSRDYLLKVIWENYEGGDEGINQAISKLRKVFKDDPKNSKIIETISKKGYRIIANIEHVSKVDKGSIENEVASGDNASQSKLLEFLKYLSTPKHLAVFVILAAFVIAVLIILYKIIYALVWS
ncbi:winged helix-turn-helix domain-containing protein [Aureisphaera galaxeae]|uniref:winged helix-turn-helix domain-containing protein n=1 Tax=Aureisphaera galaxeae TaxID=1538023 RepID=UPI002350CA54|nr:winged helix-turn-helix domain-containing protein [Aureisphaera galaxeae]MDC8002509.1 winged helix-turn-helix domain-containing protein [Aureisphaera galaxeae]